MRQLFDLWRRRYWRADPGQLAAFDGLQPVTVVTGGSDGIGLELARQFAAAGDAMLLIGRQHSKLDAAASALRKAGAKRVEIVAFDLAGADALMRFDTALRVLKVYPDVLVNNAGVGLAGSFHKHASEDVARLVALNVGALTALTRHVLPGMRVRGRGGVLNVASLAGYTPGPQQAAYYASKAYVIALSEALAHENRGYGVRVSVLAPGAVRTKFHERMGSAGGWYLKLMPVLKADRVARAGYHGFRRGQRVIIPGLLNIAMLPVLRFMPHRVTLPFVAALLNPRRTDEPVKVEKPT